MAKSETGAIRLIFLSLFITIIVAFLYPFDVSAFTIREENKLKMYYPDEQLVVTPTRYLKPISQVAENITVITSEEIEGMNAHTLADVLNFVPGIQMDIKGGPGNVAFSHIQGSEFRHVRVMIDGVTINNLSDLYADVAIMPVQHIDRIEIIKGPASSTWGSSLGGVINVITKSYAYSSEPEAFISSSVGENHSGDLRAELQGRENHFGYYLFGGMLKNKGLTSSTASDIDNLYAALDWELTKKANVRFALGYHDGSKDMGEFLEFDMSVSTNFKLLYSTFSLNSSPTENIDFNLTLKTVRQDYDYFTNEISTSKQLATSYYIDRVNTISAKVIVTHGRYQAVLGSDFEYNELESDNLTATVQDFRKRAFFLNGTITLKKFSITPGVRFDNFDIYDDFLSPSLGITYKAGDNSFLRLSIARGFSLPTLNYTYGSGIFFIRNSDLDVEKVSSYQLGFETGLFKYFWLKCSLFRHDIRDAIEHKKLSDNTSWTYVNTSKQKREGISMEIKSIPFYNFTLFSGFVFINTKDLEGSKRIPTTARYTFDTGIDYKNPKYFNFLLKGHFIDWAAVFPWYEAKDSSFIWDMNFSRKIYNKNIDTEIFMSVHNLFSVSQYLDTYYKNPDRWVEVGFKMRF